MKVILSFLKRQKYRLLTVVIITIIQCIGTLYIPFLVADIIDKGIALSNMKTIIWIGIQMFGVAAGTALLSIFNSHLCAEITATLGTDLRNALFAKTQTLSIKEFDKFGTSSLIARTTGDIVNIQQTTMMFLQMILPAPIICIAAILMTALISPIMCLIPIVSLIIFIIIAFIIIKRAIPVSQEMRKKMDNIIQVNRESIVGVRVIRAFDNSKFEQNRTDDTSADYAKSCITINKLFSYFNPCVWMVMSVAMAAVLWFGGVLVLGGNIEVGKITAITEYTLMSLSYLIMATMVATMLPKMNACVKRVGQVIYAKTEINDDALPCNEIDKVDTSLDKKNISTDDNSYEEKTALEFKNVEFKYKGAEESILRNLSFSCKTGKTTAIIGGTGSGKSTIANLMLRLNEIQSGQIFVEGDNIREITQKELRSRISYIPQKAFLFSGTIADNLKYGNPDASDEQLLQASKIAQASEFVGSLELGLQSPVSQGGKNFSGGQKQRLCIARALIKKAPICIFDDSFSALDFATDALLRSALKKEMTNTAVILIAQRISTIMDADQILVIDAGNLVGIGKHKDLMKNCPEYRSIASSQLTESEVATYDKI